MSSTRARASRAVSDGKGAAMFGNKKKPQDDRRKPAPQTDRHPDATGEDSPREGRSFYDLSLPAHQFIPFVLIALAVLSGFFLYADRTGSVLGRWFSGWMTGAFSFFAFAVPPLLLAQGILWRYDIGRRRAISRALYYLWFLISANALWYTFTPGAGSAPEAGSLYAAAQGLRAPGLLGALVGYAMKVLTGYVGMPLLSALILILFFYHFLGLTPRRLIDRRRERGTGAGPQRKREPAPYERVPFDDSAVTVAPDPTAEDDGTVRVVPDKAEAKRAREAERRAAQEERRRTEQEARERQRAQRAARRGANPRPAGNDKPDSESPEENGYFPEKEESFEEIRRRLNAEAKRYAKEDAKRKKAGLAPVAGKSAAADTSRTPQPETKPGAQPERRAEVDFAVPHDIPDGTDIRRMETDLTGAGGAAGMPPRFESDGSLRADTVFSSFDPLAGGTILNSGSPVWRRGESAMIGEDERAAREKQKQAERKTEFRAVPGGVAAADGSSVGSYKINARHMDIPNTRNPRGAAWARPEATAPGGGTQAGEETQTVQQTPADAVPVSRMEIPDDGGQSPATEAASERTAPEKPDAATAAPADSATDGGGLNIRRYVPPVTGTDKRATGAPQNNTEVGRRVPAYTDYAYPPVSLLSHDTESVSTNSEAEIKEMIGRLVEVFRKFKHEIRVHDVTVGPRVTRYSISPPDGTRINALVALSNDIALALAVKSIRIEPIPGTPYLGVEIPNRAATTVRLASLIDNDAFRHTKTITTIPLGASVTGQPVFADIAKMPHVLIAGATGMGKSVFMNSLLLSLLYKARPDEVKLILVDPKRVELSVYNGIPHLLIPPVVEAQKAAGALIWAVGEMDRRYHLMEGVGMRSIEGYNEVVRKDPSRGEIQPKIIVVIDELNDLMMQARDAVEPAIMSIAQKARAAGIHLILGTQRPSVDVITGVIKANIPSRIAFHVSSGTDSRTILDSYGAEKLLNNGDMLASIAGAEPIRVQGAFVSDAEVENVTSFLKRNAGPNVYDEIINSQIESETEKYKNSGKRAADRDDTQEADGSIFEDSKFIEACKVAFDSRKISTSLLQRSCSIGYGRAAKYIDIMQSMGIVSAPDGAKPREVLMTYDQFMEMVARETYTGD